jgi:hypothetical protein
VKERLIDYNDISFENTTMSMELEGLSDDVLLDECNFILSSEFESAIMDDVLANYFRTGNISKQERRVAEALYLLANGELAWEV